LAGGGKALRHGEKVLTPQGFVNIEDIKIGDKVITPTNTVETVKNVWPQGEVEIYRITFQDSRTIDCCGEHLWKYHIAGRGNRDSKVGDTLSLKSIVDKEHSKESGERKRLPIIPLCEPVGNTTPSDLPIHPYVLGVILGDGCLSSDNTPRVTSMDDFIFNKIENLGYKLGSVQRKENNRAYARAILDIYHHVKDLGLGQKKSQFKFIPEVYKNSSIEDKFELVRGLMDTDGYVDEEGSTYFDITSEQLSNDLREILFSLGFTAKVTAKQGKYKKNGEVVECSTVYKLYIRGNLQEKLCSLPRKVVRLRKKNVGIRVESVEYVGKDFATCIAITGEDKLFVTTNYIVTHNSAVCLMKQLDAIHDPLFRCTIFRRTAPELLRSGALVDESKKVYSHFNAEYKSQAKEWIFPSGAVVKFGAIASDDDLGGWQGSQLTRVLVDEAGEGWTEKQILFLLSRMRTAGCSIHPQLIMTANPDGASFLKKWVDYCLDENGVPKEGTENIIRWFVVLDSVVLWGDSPQELFEKHGKERGMVLATGLSDDELKKHHPSSLFMPKSFRFIPTNVFDNPYLLPPRNNSYLPNLLAQPKVNQLKYLHG